MKTVTHLGYGIEGVVIALNFNNNNVLKQKLVDIKIIIKKTIILAIHY